jgi:hypothetical protein
LNNKFLVICKFVDDSPTSSSDMRPNYLSAEVRLRMEFFFQTRIPNPPPPPRPVPSRVATRLSCSMRVTSCPSNPAMPTICFSRPGYISGPALMVFTSDDRDPPDSVVRNKCSCTRTERNGSGTRFGLQIPVT